MLKGGSHTCTGNGYHGFSSALATASGTARHARLTPQHAVLLSVFMRVTPWSCSVARSGGRHIFHAVNCHCKARYGRTPGNPRVQAGIVDLERLERGLRFLQHLLFVEHGDEAAQIALLDFAPEKDVGADIEIVGERQVLVDGLDAVVPRIDRPREMSGPAFEEHLAF